MKPANYYDQLTDREKEVYNQGFIASKWQFVRMLLYIRKIGKINANFCQWLQYQDLCASCKQWLLDWSKTQ